MDDSSNCAEECYEKLEKIKVIRQKTVLLEKVKMSIKESLEEVEVESKLLEEYKSELENLNTEKMAYVEELRQIHTDIDAMERLIKEGLADRKKTMNDARKTIVQYKSLKLELDGLRQDIGLEKSNSDDEIQLTSNATDEHSFQSGGEVNKATALDHAAGSLQVHDPLRFVTTSLENHTLQSAPMKICTSCHHSIHRNAPICPMCKAKSRSRNPKKPKKQVKQEEL